MKKDMGISGERGYIHVAGVTLGGGKRYLPFFRCGVGSFNFFYRSIGVRWVMYMRRSVREDVCFRA